ncbi:peptidase M15 [Vibrio fortis]|uniref:Peptidase M15 n=1 Tax=Vibrio fortis TaxID=212667 RepID=A0A5N3QTJ1_9VIBR|nr:D-Ala-D-Ala carboxypeptidase family metallohydrolase [Vibrio fortis]KAB0285479.1 peptidase M15 [Vibrio fortis]
MARWLNFTDDELRCSCCGRLNPNPEFITLMDLVQKLRERLNVSLSVSSAYRCENHPVERKKKRAGMHNLAAIDLKVSYGKAWRVLEAAIDMGFTGIGINQKGDPKQRFIHLDLREVPRVWSY